MALSTAIHSPLKKKNGELWSTNKKVIVAHVDLLLVDIARSAFEFGPRDFATGGISPLKFSPNRS